MQVIILNSGVGNRIGSFTQKHPKCLLKINEKNSILSNQLNILRALGLKSVIITVGPFEDQIKKEIENFNDLKIQLVQNPNYKSSNYIYSLFLVKHLIHEELLLIHGDLFFEKELLFSLLNSKQENLVIVNDAIPTSDKDFNVSIKNGQVVHIGVGRKEEDCLASFPIYKISKQSFDCWMVEIEKFICQGKINAYAEDALNNILHEQIKLKPFFSNLFCSEIDDLEDLNKVKSFLTNYDN